MIKYSLRGLIIIPILFILIFSSFCVNAEWEFQPYGNKIYYSVDRNIVLIAPDNTFNLSVHSTYEIVLFDSLSDRNLSLCYNDTVIAYKLITDKVIISNFFVNDTLFNINIKNNDSIILLSVHYIAIGGNWIPIERNAYPRIPREPFVPSPVDRLDLKDVITAFLNFTVLSILLSTVGIYIAGLFIKYIKEHKTTEGEYIAQKKYYEFYHKKQQL